MLLVSRLALAAAAQAPARVAILVDAGDAAGHALGRKLEVRLSTSADVSDFSLSEHVAANPMAKGRLLAELERSALVVVVGDGPTEFATQEIDDVPIFFLDAGVIRGRALRSARTSGIFSFNVDALLDAVVKLWPGKLGLAYTPGYGPFADWVRQGASRRGLTVVEERIAGAAEIPPALERLAKSSRSIWLAGDPLLVSGAGFEFASELSLSRRIPLIAPGLPQVEQGAALGFAAEPDGFVTPAARRIDVLLRGAPAGDARLSPAPGAGRLLLNPVLARKWGFKAPADALQGPLR